ncbi:MAG: putative aminopeptidase YsdC [Firmicutes bacterium ADurb.Bin182]|nr:MAG: putative aminopeptidase YsdC [Firmicutes bacterium ADurb.Bin182]
MFKEMLKELLYCYGPTGREKRIGELLKSLVAPYCDEVYNDALGNLIAHKKGSSGKKVMLSAHMDQIGLIVVDIRENGFLRVSNVGGVSTPISIAREVVFENGTRGVTYFETEKETVGTAQLAHLFIDIGAESREQASKLVEIGDIAVYAGNFAEMGGRFSCGALDDRLGCAVIVEALKNLETKHDLYVVFTVQEEVGLRGASTAAYSVHPDFSINLDVTRTGDTPKSARMSVSLGKGPAVKVMDSTSIIPACVRDFIYRCAEKADIPVQNEVLRGGGTDTGAILKTKGGILAGCISIPTRYVHTPVETADMNDVENAVKLVCALLAEEELPKAGN